MDNPHLTGFDGDGREYSVAADRAIQALTNPDQVRLEAIDATVAAAGPRAPPPSPPAAGDYDNGKSTLSLHGDIVVNSAEGYALRMQRRRYRFQAGTHGLAQPGDVSYQDSEITGAALQRHARAASSSSSKATSARP